MCGMPSQLIKYAFICALDILFYLKAGQYGYLVISEDFIRHNYLSFIFYCLNFEVIHDMMERLTTGIKLCQLIECVNWLLCLFVLCSGTMIC